MSSTSFERIAWALALPASVVAQVLPPVTVTATRTAANPFDVPASVSVIDGDDARSAARPEINLSESLATVPGLAVRDRQNYAQDLQLSIRGFGARSTFGVRGVRLYVDGIPATMPDGQGQLSHIDPSSVGQLDVLRGPFSVLYGNSSGGVVQVTTQPGQGEPRATATYVGGSFGLSRPGLRVSGASGDIGYVFSASHMSLDGWRAHSAVTRDVGNARLDWKPAEGRSWTFVANAVDVKADDPLGLTRAQFEAAPRGVDPSALAFDTRKTVRQQQAGGTHEAKLGAADAVRIAAWIGERHTVQYQAIPVAAQGNALHPGGVIGLQREYAGTDLRWTHAHGTALQLVAGLSYETLREHRQGWQNFAGTALGVQGALRRDEDNRVTSIDPYLQGVWKPSDRWSVTAGVRRSSVRFGSRDHYVAGTNGDDSGSLRYGATLPAFAALFAVSPRLHAYAAFGRGFETPTANELAYRPSGAAGLNFALKPSHSDNLEAGLKGRSGAEALWNFEWNAAVFETRTRDEIVTQTNSGGRSTFQNAGATRRRGVELGAAIRSGDWKLQIAQTWLDARYRDAFATCVAAPCTTPTLVIPAGNRIPGIARSFTAVEAAWQPAFGWRGGAEVRRSSRVWVNDANSDAAPAFTTAALHAGYRMRAGRWTLEAGARVDNLFDRRYAGSVIVNEGNGRFYEPAPGRSYTAKAGATYAF
ncbi:TonB-dependent receptor [Ramlibacter sp. PS4R-6]|uniref:TonB-dependent receptor n=1 Tax=Ramlibacter sp. PS4R-6 TaxID=3133438 RepID=UPI0030A71363